MSQISPPIRIVLVAAVAFLGAYMLFLRPKDEAAPPAEPAPNVQTNAPAVSQPGKVAEAAQGAVAAANGQLEQQESVDGVDAGEAAAGTQAGTTTKEGAQPTAAAAPTVDVKGLPKPIAKAIRKNKTLVLLFWNGKSADDKAVHKALAKVDRWDGRVYVGSAPIKQISKYGRIARGVDVEQSPTVVVADSQMRAETLVGYVDTRTIDQAVVDAFRNTDGVFTDPYLKKVDAVCRDYSSDVGSISRGTGVSPRKRAQFDRRSTRALADFLVKFRAVKAPAKWRAFKGATAADYAALLALYREWDAYVGTNPTQARSSAATAKFDGRENTLLDRVDRRVQGEHLTRCGSQYLY